MEVEKVHKPLNGFFVVFFCQSAQYLESSRRFVKEFDPDSRKQTEGEIPTGFPMLIPFLRVQHHWHKATCCKSTNGNSQDDDETVLRRFVAFCSMSPVFSA